MKYAIIKLDNQEEIKIKFHEEHAFNTVKNFCDLANKEFYDGLTFHRVIKDFVSQGGCPLGTGTGGPGYTIQCETKNNPHKHVLGAVSMAHRGPNTGGSQFFICHQAFPHLDGIHTVFGQVIENVEAAVNMKQGTKMVKVTIIEE